jgi:hypothetical protein
MTPRLHSIDFDKASFSKMRLFSDRLYGQKSAPWNLGTTVAHGASAIAAKHAVKQRHVQPLKLNTILSCTVYRTVRHLF